MAFVFRSLPTNQPMASNSDETLSSVYPPPNETTIVLTPTTTETETPLEFLKTATLVPITPHLTLTLIPGPIPTLIPLINPVEDATGTIFYIAQDKQSANPSLDAVDVNSTGNISKVRGKVSDITIPIGSTMFPSPNGDFLAVQGDWGTFSIINISKGLIEKTSISSLGSSGIFFNWFPDNRHILFGDELGPLVLSDPFTGEQTLLAIPELGKVSSGAASPDGQFVVYSYDTNKVHPRGIWIVNSSGQDAHLLVKDVDPTNISWSPNGKQIAFFYRGWQVVNADGSNLREIAPGIILPQCFRQPPLWSPDSRSLAVVTTQSGEAFCNGWKNSLFKDTNIFLIDVDSGKAHPLLSDGSFGNIDPSWSPDGKKVVFVSLREGVTPEIWTVNTDGTNPLKITESQIFVRFPQWHKAH